MKHFLFILLAALSLPAAAQTEQERAFLPPTMGWSSWNTYAAKISEDIICRQADAAIEKGFAEAGYRYINIDDGFFYNRDADGRLIIHPTRFPNGLRVVADYIHSKGLQAGIYSDAGHNTCASFWGEEKEAGGIGAGLYEHDVEDCEMYFNEMDFDFIKVDFCGGAAGNNSENLVLDQRTRYTEIANAIRATGKNVVYNICCWNFPGTWARDIADSWRISEDIYDGWASVKSIAAQNLYLSAYCGDGHYNDMDMLEVGRSMSAVEDQTHFALWCIFSSPLLIGCDMASVSDEARELLCNPELIAINQDPLGLQAYVAKTTQGTYTLVKDVERLHGLTRAVAVYNPTDYSRTVTIDFADLDLAGNVLIRDLAARQDLGTFQDTYTVTLPAHGTAIMKCTAETRLMRTKYEAETAWLTEYQELSNNQSAGTAVYTEALVCSGGMKVGWLGGRETNDLQWRDVFVPTAGEYEMTLAFICGSDRDVHVSVNGTEQTVLTCNGGSWSNVSRKTATLKLQEGSNVIRLWNADGWMPDIDCMTLAPTEATAIQPVAIATKDARNVALYDLNGRQVSADGDTTHLPAGTYVGAGRKVLKN